MPSPAMRNRGAGSIINISSIYGLIGSSGSAAYHGTKGAVRLLTKAAAVQYAPDNIRVNSIHPGLILTPMLDIVGQEELQPLIECDSAQTRRPLSAPRLTTAQSLLCTCHRYGVALRIDEDGNLVVGRADARAEEDSQPWPSLLIALEAKNITAKTNSQFSRRDHVISMTTRIARHAPHHYRSNRQLKGSRIRSCRHPRRPRFRSAPFKDWPAGQRLLTVID